jgi:hypothetical protein
LLAYSLLRPNRHTRRAVRGIAGDLKANEDAAVGMMANYPNSEINIYAVCAGVETRCPADTNFPTGRLSG